MTLIKIKGEEFDEATIQKMIDLGMLGVAEKNDPASTTLTAPALHGPLQGNANQLGAFSSAGVRPQRFSAGPIRMPDFTEVLGMRRSEYTNEILEIKTGVEETSFTNASGYCGDPPSYGSLKTCQQSYTFGFLHFKTNLNALAAIGQLNNRADLPGQVLNDAMNMNPMIPDILGRRISDDRSQLQLELYNLGIGVERAVEQVNFNGVAATSNNAYYGVGTQWKGLASQITTGITDVSNYACPAADSIVETFNANVTGTDSNSRSVVEAFTDLMFALSDTAQGVGMDGTTWAICMRKGLFRRLTDVFAYNYASYRLTGSAGNPSNVDSMVMQQMRLDMWNGRYLLIDGVAYPVILTEGPTRETLGNNFYKSDIFVVPVAWNGIPLTVMEYYPMDNQYTQEFANFLSTDDVRTINNGMYLVGKRDTGLCVEYIFQAKVRLILEAPFLAGRLDDVWYTYLPQTRDALPGTSLYKDGGVSIRS